MLNVCWFLFLLLKGFSDMLIFVYSYELLYYSFILLVALFGVFFLFIYCGGWVVEGREFNNTKGRYYALEVSGISLNHQVLICFVNCIKACPVLISL